MIVILNDVIKSELERDKSNLDVITIIMNEYGLLKLETTRRQRQKSALYLRLKMRKRHFFEKT